MKTYFVIVAGAMRSVIALASLMAVYIHWTWWMADAFPHQWWLYDLPLATVLALLWGSTSLMIRVNKGN